MYWQKNKNKKIYNGEKEKKKKKKIILIGIRGFCCFAFVKFDLKRRRHSYLTLKVFSQLNFKP